MPAPKKVTAEYLIDFKARGLLNIENELKKLSTEVPKILKDATKFNLPIIENLKLLDSKIAALGEASFKKIEEFSSAVNNGLLTPNLADKYVKEFMTIASEAKKIKAEMLAYQQVIKMTAKGTEEAFLKNLQLYEELGGSKKRVDGLLTVLANLDKELAKPAGLDKFKALNAELEREVRFLKELKNLKEKTASAEIPKKYFKDTLKEANQYKKIVLSKSSTTVEKGIAEKELRNLSILTDKVINKTEQLNLDIKKLAEAYNLPKSKIQELNREVYKSAELTLKSKKFTPLVEMGASLNKLKTSLREEKSEFNGLFKSLQNSLDKFIKNFNTIEVSPNIKKEILSIVNSANKELSKSTKLTTADLKKLHDSIYPILNSVPKLQQTYLQIQRLMGSLKAVGVPKNEIENLNKELDKLFITAAKTGNIGLFKGFSENLKKMVAEYEAGAKKVKQLSDLKIKLPAPSLEEVSAWKEVVQNASKLERELLSLERRYSAQVGSLERMINSKKRWASTADIKFAEKELESFRKKLSTIHSLQKRLASDMSSGKLNKTWMTDALKDTNRLEKDLYSMMETTKHAKAQLAEMSSLKWMANVAKRAVGYAALYMGIYEVVNIIKQGIGWVLEFNKTMTTMAAVFEVTVPRAKALGQQLVALGKTYGGSIKDINEAALALGRAGIATKDVIKATEIVIKMAKLTGDSIAVSSSAVITYQQVFADAQHPITLLGDELAYVANQSRMSTQDIGTFSNYALAAAKAANLSVEAVNAMAIAFSNAGVNASTIGTQIRRFSALLTDNSADVKRFFAAIGVVQREFSTAMLSSTEESNRRMVWLVRRLSKMTKDEFAAATAGMDILAKNSLTLLRNNADAFLRHYKTLSEGVNGELDKTNIIAESYISTWEQLSNAIGDSFYKLTDKFFPAVKSAGEELITIFNYVSENSEQIKQYAEDFISLVKNISLSLAALVGLDIASSVFNPKTIQFTRVNIKLLIKELKQIKNVGLASIFAGAIPSVKVLLSSVKSILNTIKSISAIFLRSPWLTGIGLLGAGVYYIYQQLSNTNKELEKTVNLTNKLGSVEVLKKSFEDAKKQLRDLVEEETKLREKLQEAIRKGNIEEQNTLIKKLTLLENEKSLLASIALEKEKAYQLKEEETALLTKKAELQILERRLAILESSNGAFSETSKEAQRLRGEIEKLSSEINKSSLSLMNEKIQFKLSTLEKEREKVISEYNKIFASLEQNKAPNEAFQIYTKQLEIALKGIDTQINNLIESKKKLTNEFSKNIENEPTGIGFQFELDNNTISNIKRQIKTIRDYYQAGFNITDAKTSLEKNIQNILDLTVKSYTSRLKISIQNIINQINNDIASGRLSDTIGSSLKKEFKKIESLASEPKKAQLALDNLTLKLKSGVIPAYQYTGQIEALASELGQVIVKFNSLDSTMKKFEQFNMPDLSQLKTLFTAGSVAEQAFIAINNHLERFTTAAGKTIKVTPEMINAFNNLVLSMNKLNSVKASGGFVSKKQQQELETSLQRAKEAFSNSIKFGEAAIVTEQKLIEETKRWEEMLNRVIGMYKNNLNLPSVGEDIWQKGYKIMEDLLIDPETLKTKNKEGLDAYFNWYFSEVQSKSEEFRELRKRAEGFMSILPDTTSASTIINTFFDLEENTEDIRYYYEGRRQIVQEAYRATLQQMEINGAAEIEKQRLIEEKKTELIRLANEERAQLELATFNGNLAIANNFISGFSNVFDTLIQSGAVKSKKLFQSLKLLRVAEAIINTYAGAVRVYADVPYPFNIAASAMIVAQGMANVAAIKAQQPPASYHTGGYVGTATPGAVGGLRDDEIPAILQKGEYVLSRKDIELIKSVDSKSPVTPAPQQPAEIVIINQVDESVFEEWATSRTGREVINNVVNR